MEETKEPDILFVTL